MRAPRIQGASRRRGVPFPEGRRTGTGPSAGRVRRRPAPGDNGPQARELAEGPGPDARGRIVLALGRSRASLPELREPQGAAPHLRQDVDARHSMRSDMARLPMPVMWIRRKRTQSGRKVKNMNLEDLIVSTISDTKPMMILALCTIVLFVIVASLIEAWLAKARKAKSETDTLPSGPEASQRSVEKSEAVEQAVDNAGGFDLDERRPARRNRSRTGAHGSSRP